MKIRANWLIVPAAVLSFAACNKKEEAQVPDAPATSETEPASPGETPAPTAPTSSLSTEERAAKLGFVKHLPQDTEVVLAFHNGSKAATHIKSSKLWELVQSELSPMFGGGPPMEMEIEEDDFEMEEVEQDTAATDDDEEVAEPSGPAALFGSEFSMAMGKSTGAQTANLIMLNQRLGYFQMRAISKAFVTSLKTGDFSTMEDSLESTYGPELVTDLLNDSESGVALFEQMRMPPMYFAFRATSENRASAAQQLASLVENLAMLGELVEPVSVEKDGQTFAGQKISGKQLANMMDMEGRKDLEEMLEPEMVNRLITAVSKKDLVILTGTVGDYAVLFIGASPDDLAFAADPASSLVGNDALAFSDAYASKELAALVYGQKASIDQMIHAAGGLSHFANGLRDGLAGSEGLGDTRDIEELLRIVSERESALMKLAGNDALGTVAFFEDGLKIESFGGSDSGAIDWKSPNKLASLGDSEDVVLFANVTVNAGYDEKAHDYLEALMETAYAIMTKVAEAPAASSDMTQFKEMATMFDSKFRADLVAMWSAFSNDFGSSLGHECALVIDLDGSLPAVPGIPQPIVDEAKFPRISMVAPVTDRAKLSSSWEKMNTSATTILANISEMLGQDIPMQKPISSEKDGNTTWFFSLPFFNDDFLPSVTVGDKWFAASSSKNQAIDLISKADTSTQTRNGLFLSVNFKALQKFSSETLEVIRKNSDSLPNGVILSESDMKDAANVINILDDLDSFTVHARREGGIMRSSVHLKTR